MLSHCSHSCTQKAEHSLTERSICCARRGSEAMHLGNEARCLVGSVSHSSCNTHSKGSRDATVRRHLRAQVLHSSSKSPFTRARVSFFMRLSVPNISFTSAICGIQRLSCGQPSPVPTSAAVLLVSNGRRPHKWYHLLEPGNAEEAHLAQTLQTRCAEGLKKCRSVQEAA